MNAQRVSTLTTGSETPHGSTANVTADNEHHLISDAKSGKSAAFGELYERHRMRIYLTVFRIRHCLAGGKPIAKSGRLSIGRS